MVCQALKPRLAAVQGLCGALLFAAALAQAAEFQASKVHFLGLNPVTPLTAATFAHPLAIDRPWARMNLTPMAESTEIQAELEEMNRSGIAGVEVGQWTFPTDAQLKTILGTTQRLGMRLSLSHGPTVAPERFSNDDDNVRKMLDVSGAPLDAGAGFDGPIIPPVPDKGPFWQPTLPSPRTALVAVVAYRCVHSPCASSRPVLLDRSSAINLSAAIRGQHFDGYAGGSTTAALTWKAPSSPAGSQWLVMSFWVRGVFAQPDPFSREGTDELIDGIESALGRDFLFEWSRTGGDIFYDSHSVDRGSPDELWTNKMAEEFRSRRGYSLVPLLAALFPTGYRFDDNSDRRIRDDLYAVRGELWIEKHILPMEEWAHSHNLRLRLQPEGEGDPTVPINDQIQAAAALDRPEHESLFTADEVDNYLPIASANHMDGNPWYSTECCAAFNQNYAQGYRDLTVRMHRSFAGGITRLIYHVFPYRDEPQAKWPGYHRFGSYGFSNAWGRRNPFWIDAPLFNDYLARNQQVLTQGDAKTDVAIYLQNYLYPPPPSVPGGFRMWRDTKLQEAGFTRDYVNPTLLSLPNATVRDGHLAVDGPAYKALVIDGDIQPASDPLKTAMPLEVARKILGYAQSGLPIIIVGAAPDSTPGDRPADDPKLQALIRQLRSLKNVHSVMHESDVPSILVAIGIRPSLEPDQWSSFLSVRRYDASTRTDYYYIYNQEAVSPPGEPYNLFNAHQIAPAERQVTLEGHGQPYLMDAWSGKVTPVMLYSSDGDHIRMKVRMASDDAAIIAIAGTPTRFGFSPPSLHVVSTDGDSAIALDSNIIGLRTSRGGSIRFQMSDGRTGTTNAVPFLPAIDLTSERWQLTVEDWQPENPYDTTFGVSATRTTRKSVTLALQGVKPWSEIPALAAASGIGTYTVQFELPRYWSAEYGATLSLGKIVDTFSVVVNGIDINANEISGDCDLGATLHAGLNSMTVRVATTLNNRLRQLGGAEDKKRVLQDYGLSGPVKITPYRIIPLLPP